MNKFLLLGLIALITVYIIFQSYKYPSTESIKSLDTPAHNESPQPSTYPEPTVKSSEVGEGKNLIEIEEYQLNVEIPSDWKYKLLENSVVTIYKNDLPTYYKGSLLLEDPALSIKIGIVPNLQGGWCEGPTEPKKEVLPMKFGLPVTKFTCGSIYYLYGDLNKPGSVIPNLFISINSESNPQVRDIINSINYIPTN